MCAPQKQPGLAPTTSPDERPRLSSIQEPTNHDAGISSAFMPSSSAQPRSISADSFEVSSAFKAAEGRAMGCSNSSPAEKLVCCLDACCGSGCATQRLRARSGMILRIKRIRLFTVAFYKGPSAANRGLMVDYSGCRSRNTPRSVFLPPVLECLEHPRSASVEDRPVISSLNLIS